MILLPWWIYLCILGILYSGYMAFSTTRKEKIVEEAYIEKEGNIYIERMLKEREIRKNKQDNEEI
ncbi:sporulation YhaL family protein [Metabacillus idriensis]|uniref:sporulation YhaL family protein n=1 Tax=Metabacillus idriensis TaxID=324768 RepID=UPI001639AAB2|nr:sporulation YhaL family protein [Metabacillus idriensis]QNG59739.1 sporulation YhaL family protein [Bacillus sp. PAMC26568]